MAIRSCPLFKTIHGERHCSTGRFGAIWLGLPASKSNHQAKSFKNNPVSPAMAPHPKALPRLWVMDTTLPTESAAHR